MRVARFIGGLSRRELEVVDGVCRGLQNKEIAWGMHISDRTVKAHLFTIYRRLGVTSRHSLLMWAVANGAVRREDLKLQVVSML